MALADKLARSLDAGWRDFDIAVAAKIKELGMGVSEVREYMEGFRFRMTDAERQAIIRFRQLDAAIRKEDTARIP